MNTGQGTTLNEHLLNAIEVNSSSSLKRKEDNCED